MNRLVIGIIIGLVVGAGLAWFVGIREKNGHGEVEPAAETHPDTEKEHQPNVVVVSPEAQKKAGLVIASPEVFKGAIGLKAYGRIMDPSPFIALIYEIESAESTVAISKKEHERVKGLYALNQNASLQALELAEAALKRDQISLESARARLSSTWGPRWADRSDLAQVTHRLATLDSGLARLELLPGQVVAPPESVRLKTLNEPALAFEGQFVGMALRTDAQSQGVAFLFLVSTNAAPPGTAIHGVLPGPPISQPCVRIPAAAVIRYLGALWVFVQVGEDRFERRLVAPIEAVEGDLVIGEGLISTDRVVVTGAQLLLSEQLKTALPEE